MRLGSLRGGLATAEQATPFHQFESTFRPFITQSRLVEPSEPTDSNLNNRSSIRRTNSDGPTGNGYGRDLIWSKFGKLM